MTSYSRLSHMKIYYTGIYYVHSKCDIVRIDTITNAFIFRSFGAHFSKYVLIDNEYKQKTKIQIKKICKFSKNIIFFLSSFVILYGDFHSFFAEIHSNFLHRKKKLLCNISKILQTVKSDSND